MQRGNPLSPVPVSEAVPRPDGFQEGAKKTVARLRDEGYSPATIRDYSYAMGRMHKALSRLGRVPAVRRFTEKHLAILREAFAYSPRFLSTVDMVLRAMGSPVRLRVRIPPRTKYPRLSRTEATVLMDTALQLGPPYSALVFLEMSMGYRRVSVRRAMLRDFRGSMVLVHGKAAGLAPNDYTIAPPAELPAILVATEAWRPTMDSDYLIPSSTGGMLSESGADRILAEAHAKAGVPLRGHHALRRTFGREMWEAAVPLPVIRDAMGHKSIDQTIAYLGLDASDQAEAMRKLSEYRKRPQVYLSPEGQS